MSGEGTRLGQLIGGEPELTRPLVTGADREMSRRLCAFVLAEGLTPAEHVTRMERLKFETIVTGKTCAEVLAGRLP